MKRIELFERAIAEKARNLKDYGINSTMFWAYRKSMEAETTALILARLSGMRTLKPLQSA